MGKEEPKKLPRWQQWLVEYKWEVVAAGVALAYGGLIAWLRFAT